MPVFNTVVQPFTSIMNATLRDERLSLKAHGLLGYMLSMSGEWQFYTAEIAKHFPDGEKAIRSAVNELIAAGYVVKQQPRVSGGRMGETVWNVYGVPDAQNRHAVKSLAPQHSENANADITALSPDSQNRHAVKSPVSQRSENVNADTTALSPDAQNRHAVKSPVPQRSKKTNVDMKAFSPDAGLRHAVKGRLRKNNSKNNQKELTTRNNKVVADYDDDNQEPKEKASSVVVKGQVTESHSFHQVTQFWQEQGFGALAPLTADKLRNWRDDFQAIGSSSDDAAALLILGMETAIDAGHTNYGYLNGILHNWESKRLTNVAAVKASEQQRAASQSSPARGHNRPTDLRSEVYHDSDWDAIDARYAAEDAAKAKQTGGEAHG
ncbi:DnaD domain protein [Lacticaseibacillus sharpeae]|uniref:DnaB/C C-terminal domain-containing protein n=1 Tax=Lacticaseibacillus sharpeae JCM 1186 = DSM 20505 TaxID=1291052 RepID=A0A0R1ZMD7_9LACO|nr:DnaD domain protein [Lacticaseibacillus sharpeae]KRM56224.1 hypothetical protein FC18_GL000201 [Lacticaseibacillus sharpeae JCM 1186 = DSM 20505]